MDTMEYKTLFEKVWDEHIVPVQVQPNRPSLIYIDLHLIHEVTSPQAFEGLRINNHTVRCPNKTFATMDHNVPTIHRDKPIKDPISAKQVQVLQDNCKEFGITLFDLNMREQGIVHVIGPELGLTQPGKTIVCGDSHTSTHGAFGALAFGIGTSQVEHVLATQCLWQKKPKTMRVFFNGKLNPGVYSKDMILKLIGIIGTAGATGYVLEYAGDTIPQLSIEARMTICNMSIEAGARAGMMAPDDKTIQYLASRPYVPKADKWDLAIKYWQSLYTDAEATFDNEIVIDCNSLVPQVTWGTSPGMVQDITGVVPSPNNFDNSTDKIGCEKALEYMNLKPGTPIKELPINKVFIGSCTNSRIEDIREAAQMVKGHKKASSIESVLVVPGSHEIKEQAEAEKLDVIFKEAGFEWREPGCSMCLAMNDDILNEGDYCASTSNRNFEGRQGKGGRTFLVSPAMATLAAIHGHFVDSRKEI